MHAASSPDWDFFNEKNIFQLFHDFSADLSPAPSRTKAEVPDRYARALRRETAVSPSSKGVARTTAA